jgi:hypothetical protein
MDALERVADKVELISTFRSYDADGEPERQEALHRQGEALAKRIAAQWRAAPAQERPDLWFTYHVCTTRRPTGSARPSAKRSAFRT